MHSIPKLLYYCTTILRYYYTPLLLYYYTTTIRLYFCTTVLLCYSTAILLYYYTTVSNCGTWGLTQQWTDKLDAPHRQHLRRLLGIFYPNHISNTDLYEKCQAEPLSRYVKKARWSLLGHVLRLPREAPAQKALDTYVTAAFPGRHGKRQTGLMTVLKADLEEIKKKLPRRWDLRQAGFGGPEQLEGLRMVAPDRSSWRNLCGYICCQEQRQCHVEGRQAGILLYKGTLMLVWYRYVVYLYYYTTILLYYCATTLLYYCTTILLCSYTTVLLYYYTTVLLYYCATILLYYCTTILLCYYTTILLYCYTTILLYKGTLMLVCYRYRVFMLLCYYTTMLLYYWYYCTTILLSYYTRAPLCWCDIDM